MTLVTTCVSSNLKPLFYGVCRQQVYLTVVRYICGMILFRALLLWKHKEQPWISYGLLYCYAIFLYLFTNVPCEEILKREMLGLSYLMSLVVGRFGRLILIIYSAKLSLGLPGTCEQMS